MTGYNQLWESVRNSPMVSQYVWELYWLADDVVNRAAAIAEKTPPPDPGSEYLKVDFSVHHDIFALLSSASKIKALITPKTHRNQNQSQTEFKFQQRRAAWLANLLDGIKLKQVHKNTVRHTIEHFDEYIDRTAIRLVEDRIQKPVHLPTDMAVSSRQSLDVLKGTRRVGETLIYPIRVYIADERLFVNCGKEIDIGSSPRNATKSENASPRCCLRRRTTASVVRS